MGGNIEGYDVKIKVLDQSLNPVFGAEVTLHSNVRTGMTDINGEVEFTSVEGGEHTVIVAYNGMEGEQTVQITGEQKEIFITIELQQRPQSSSSSLTLLIVIVLAALGLLFLLLWFRKRRKDEFPDELPTN